VIDLEDSNAGYLSPLKNFGQDFEYNFSDQSVDTPSSSVAKKLKSVKDFYNDQ